MEKKLEIKTKLLNLISLINAAYSFDSNQIPIIPVGYKVLDKIYGISVGKKELFGVLFNKINTNEYVLAFRGTVSAENWIDDANITQTKIDGETSIETGFYSIFKTMEQKIYEIFQIIFEENLLNKRETKIEITGHSLGGALASITTWYFERIFRSVFQNNFRSNLVTFASPRVGNLGFTNTVNSKSRNGENLCVINYADVVPFVPLPVVNIWNFQAFYHDVIPQLFFSDNQQTFAGNHSLNTYQKNIEKM